MNIVTRSLSKTDTIIWELANIANA